MAVTVSEISDVFSEKLFKTYNLEHLSQSRLNYKTYTENTILRVTDDLSYEEFFELFLVKNKPCVIAPVDKSSNLHSWGIRTWVTKDGTPNWSEIGEKFGSSVVPVADCAVKEYNAQRKEYVFLPHYIKYCQQLVKENYNYEKMPCLYLKDWHLCRSHPQFIAYETPKYFQSDWLNSYYISQMEVEDDYRFVYIGPKGTWTPFHADVFGSFSWSANICGRKRWLLFPPGAEKFFLDVNGKLAFDIMSEDIRDTSKYTKASQYFEEFGTGIEVIQEAGEIIFVPSGWHHQVWNLEDTISVNHNWFNGCSVDLILQNMFSAFQEVTDELQDCKDDENFHQTCQLVLNAHHGMNFGEFVSLLQFVVAEAQKTFVSNTTKCFLSVFDLNCVLFVIKTLRESHRKLLEDLRLASVLLEIENNIQSFLLKNYLPT